ncbi:glycoside hydrolase family 88 protein [Flavobacteriaceae bacterium]|nr:glycoside hydrolase family 88 protein [Flavobacteriaceae bacterium]
MNKFLLFFSATLFFACQSADDRFCCLPPGSGVEFAAYYSIKISLMDAQGNSLLNTDHPNAISLEQTKIYQYYKRVKTLDENSFYHKRRNLDPDDPVKVGFDLYQKEKNGDYIKSSIIIEWHNKQSNDTLTGNFNWKEEELHQLWVNNVLYEGDLENITLIKN